MLLQQNAIRQKNILEIILKLKACSIGPNFNNFFLKILCTVGFPLFMSKSAVAKEEEEEEDLGGGGKLHNRDFIDPSKVFNVCVITCKQLDL